MPFNIEDNPEIKKILDAWDCGDCGVRIQKILNRDCEECGEGISEEELHLTLIGLDVVGLFPAMMSKTTGEIILKMVLKSMIQIRGFQWKQGVRYILLNKHLTGDLEVISGLLPKTKSGYKVGMFNKGVNSRKENIDEKWLFREQEPNENEIMEIVARVAEIGTRIIFENFNYKFGGNTYQQASGGPIGARVNHGSQQIGYGGLRLQLQISTGTVQDGVSLALWLHGRCEAGGDIH